MRYVVAEERSRRLAVFSAADGAPCAEGDVAPCGPFELTASIELPAQPHNLAAAGPVVYATHPSAGTISRVDVEAATVLTQHVGVEPHDVKTSPVGEVLYVADEDGRALLLIDPATLDEIDRVDLPAKPHDLAVGPAGEVWITLIGEDRLGVYRGGDVDYAQSGGSPHDLIVAPEGSVWFSNWDSHELLVFDPETGRSQLAPAAVVEPHHFALDSNDAIWVTDNGGSTVVGFVDGDPRSIEVGSVPHHIAFGPDAGVVAVSGSGEAVFIDGTEVIGRVPLTTGLHGAAVVILP